MADTPQKCAECGCGATSLNFFYPSLSHFRNGFFISELAETFRAFPPQKRLHSGELGGFCTEMTSPKPWSGHKKAVRSRRFGPQQLIGADSWLG